MVRTTVNVVALPARIVTVLEPRFRTARSVVPSRLKSPATRAMGVVPTGKSTVWLNVVVPSPSRMDTRFPSESATARSVFASAFQSPETTATGWLAAAASAFTV